MRVAVLRRRRATSLLAVAACGLLTAVSTGAVTASAAHASVPASFTAGDVVVYRVGTGTGSLGSAATAVFLDEYTPAGALVLSDPLPTTSASGNFPVTGSGSASSEGLLTLSANSNCLVATGYDAAVGTASISGTKAANDPRTVATVTATEAVNSSTALTDFADKNNPRSAASSDCSHFWVGGAGGGVRYVSALGATTSTEVVNDSTADNIREVSIVDGQLYASADPTKNTPAFTVATVGTGLPTTAANITPSALYASSTAEPFQYSLLTLGSGTTPDTLYVADSGAGAVIKYSLISGSWVAKGSVTISGVSGLTANDASGTVSIYASTTGGGTGGALYSITDSSGAGGTLSGTATQIATAASNETFRGVAFAPGTVIGSGGGTVTPPTPPTITPAFSGLPAALGDPTNPTLSVAVSDPNFTASQLTTSVTSANTTVAPTAGVSLTGTGATRTLTVTPAAVGYSTITLTVNAPDGTSANTTITYAASANQGDPSDRYFDGAGNLLTAIDVGGGYMLVGDDESNVIRLYNEADSSEPVNTFDFTSLLPFGTAEVDIEASARIGNTLYWTGSMSNSTSGNVDPERSTLFAATISGTGASTTLTYQGSYTGLLADAVAWDQSNGHGLGANYLGLAASSASGVDGHDSDAFDVEGMEAVQGSSTSAYLAFRAPLEPTTNRHLALVVPITNVPSLTTNGNPGSTHATFGAPMFWNLGGLGIREIRKNVDGQYLIIAGTADGTNTSFVLYTWDGNPADQPQTSGQSLPLIPSGDSQGSWETIVNVPDPLVTGSSVQLVQDNGDTAWYGDGATEKSGLAVPIQKDMGRTFTLTVPGPVATSTSIAASTTQLAIGQSVTYSATVSSTQGVPTGTLTFDDGGTPISTCTGIALDSTQSATCTVSYPGAAQHSITAVYNGSTSFATSTSTVLTESVNPWTLTLTANDASVPFGSSDPSFGYTAGGLMGHDQVTTQPTCGVSGAHTAVGTYSINCSGADAGPNYTIVYKPGTFTVTQRAVTPTVSPDNNPVVTGQPVTFTANVGVNGVSTVPTGTIDFGLTGCSAVTIVAGSASCTVTGGFAAGSYPIQVTYSGDTDFASGTSGTGLLIEQVDAAATVVTVAGDVASPVTGQPLTYTATVAVSAPGSTTPADPTGTVTFQADGVNLPGCAAVTVAGDGTAACPVNAGFGPPSHTIAVSYSGDANFASSAATPLTQDIAPDATTVALVADPNPPVVGTPVTYTATVSAAAPGSGAPSGSVAFSDSAGPIAACATQPVSTLAPYVATCTTSEAAAGADQITAGYLGDGRFNPSSLTITVDAVFGPPTTIVISPDGASIAGGSYQAYTVTGTDAAGDDLGDISAETSFTISPDGTCTADSCTAAIPGPHTVTGTDGAASASVSLTVTAGPQALSPRDIVGVGDDLSQYGFEFVGDGSPGVAGGFNNLGNNGRLISFDATSEANGQASYSAPDASGSSASFDPSVILGAGALPSDRVQNSTGAIAALLADTGEVQGLQYVRTTRIPTAAEQSQAGANGWGGLHVVQYASDAIEIAVSAAGTNAPAGLSLPELAKIYDGTYTTWGQVPGYSGDAPNAAIIALLPAAGTDTRALFDADLAAGNGGAAVHYAASVIVVPENDYTQIARVASPADAIYPFSAGQLTLLGKGYFGSLAEGQLTALTGTAPDGTASYAVSHPLYLILRDSDISTTNSWRGTGVSWAKLLFVGPNATFGRTQIAPQLTAAGLTPAYADLGDASS